MSLPLVLGQTLHGYSQGHRLLASSVELDVADARYVLSASDLAESPYKLSDAGYITGYPLNKSGFFAIARTWPAKEISRPGCVWTHTIYVRFPDLAKLVAAKDLFSVFARPGSSGFDAYECSLSVHPAEQFHPALGGTASEFVVALEALYGAPHVPARIGWNSVTESADERAQVAVLELWMQQWPRLKRSIRFCSWAPPSNSSDTIDLALYVLRPSTRSSATGSLVDISRGGPAPPYWCAVALDDLVKPLPTSPLRAFLMEAGADSVSGRAAFAPLCEIFGHLSGNEVSTADLSASIAVLRASFAEDEVSALRKRLCREVLSQVENADSICLNFLLENLESLSQELTAVHLARLGQAVWHLRPQLLFETPVLLGTVSQSLRLIPLVDIVQAVRNEPELLSEVARRRPEVLDQRSLWEGLKGNDLRSMIELLRDADVEVPWEWPARAAAEAMDETLLGTIVNRISQRQALDLCRALLQGPQADTPVGTILWSAAIREPSGVAWYLANSSDLEEYFLEAIARRTHPDYVLNEYGEDPWFEALDARHPGSEFLLCYVMSRAFGRHSRSSLGLFRLVFEPLYALAAGSRDPDGWNIVVGRLPAPWPWFEWDRCQRLRAAAVELFVQGRANRRDFLSSIEDEKIFWLVCEQAADTWAGRELLRSVASDKTSADAGRRRALTHWLRKL